MQNFIVFGSVIEQLCGDNSHQPDGVEFAQNIISGMGGRARVSCQ